MSEPMMIEEVPIVAAWNVQGDASRSDFAKQVAQQFAIQLPSTPNTTARADTLTALWLGPRSWLLVAQSPASRFVEFDQKRDALNSAGGALFDVSASRVAYRLTGERALEVLATGCPLDLHPRTFRTGDCAQSVFGHTNVLLYKVDDAPIFTIMVARSFARDVRHALDIYCERRRIS
ncbi:MAG: sarcosine oxidase subunit gamma [Burkholderiaceae bacterium]